MALTAKLDGTYRKRLDGGRVSGVRWRYIVSGTPEEEKDYLASDDKIIKNEEGKPLLFTTAYRGDTLTLEKSMNTKRYFVKADMFLEKLKSMAEQHGGDVGGAFAGAFASEAIKGIRTGAPSTTKVVTEGGDEKKEPEKQIED